MNNWDPQQNWNRQELNNAANKISANISAENYENRKNLLKIEIAKAQDRTTKAELQRILDEMEAELARRKTRNRIISAILLIVFIIIFALFFPFIKNKMEASHNLNNPKKIEVADTSLSTYSTDNVSTSETTSNELKKSNTSNSTSSQQSVKNDVVDTKNLTSDQLRQWISAVLNAGGVTKNFAVDVETGDDGYAHGVANFTDVQTDPIGNFRVNSNGQLEEAGLYYGKPGEWIVVSPSFMDTTHIPKRDSVDNSENTSKVSLTSYVGENYETVLNSLINLGFDANNIGVSYESSDTVPSGSIISQTPETGEVVPSQAYISFRVSQGPDSKTLDDISGYTREDAQNYLSGIGAVWLGHETYENSLSVDKDKVIRTVPSVGTTITPGTVVDVVYSSGS